MSKFTAEYIKQIAAYQHREGCHTSGDMLDEYAAILTRQPEVSEEVERHLKWVSDITSDPEMVLTKPDRERIHRYANEALTAVWHNRPAQEDLDGFVDAVAAYKEIGELLAVIHADGGHYKDAHGFKKAAVDAKEIVWAMKGQLNSRPAQDRLCERNPAPDASVPLAPSSSTVVLSGPAQEKAELVAIGRIDESESGMFVDFYPDRDLPLGAEVYTVPLAERAQEKAEPVAGGRLPKIPHELYEMYPPMSAQNHAEHVRAYARLAIAAVTPPAERAQEKMNPVARVRISESGSLGISALPGMSRKLSHGQELYTAPPAERVRVPENGNE